MRTAKWLIGISLFIAQTSYCQFTSVPDSLLKAGISFSKSNLDSAVYYFEECRRIAFQSDQYNLGIQAMKWKVQAAVDLNQFGRQRIYLEQLEDTLFTYNSCLPLNRQEALAVDTKAMWAGYYLRIGRSNQALETNREVIDLLRQKPNPNSRDSFLIYRSHAYLAQIFKNTGDFDSAIRHYWEGMSYIRHDSAQIRMGRIGLTHSQMAECYRQLKRYDKARENYQFGMESLWSFYPQVDEDVHFRLNKNLLACHQNFARYYLEQGKIDSAILKLQQALQLDYTPLFRVTHDLLGQAYTSQKQWTQAAAHLKKALWLKQEQFGKEHYELGVTYNLMGHLAAARGRLEEALSLFEQATASHGPLESRDLVAVEGKPKLLRNLLDEAEMYWKLFRKRKQKGDLQVGLERAMQALQLMDVIRSEFTADWDKQLMLDQRYRLFEVALNMQYAMDSTDHHALFSLLERSKATVLMDQLRTARNKATADIPLALLEREQQLRSEAAQLRLRISESVNQSNLRAQLFVTLERYRKLNDTLEQQYLSQYRNPSESYSLTEAMASLSAEQAAIEYFLGDSTLYIVLLTPHRFQSWMKPLPKDLNSVVRDLRMAISDPNRRRNQLELSECAVLSGRLFDWLIRQPFDSLPDETNQLTIVPDGTLGLLPFEMLHPPMNSTTGYEQPPYLLMNYRISYAYSMGLLEVQQRRRSIRAKRTFAGFAPNYFPLPATGSNGLPPLEGARKQVIQVAHLLGGDSFLEEDASKATFLELLSDYQIYLLAMHALVDEQQPMRSRLMFTPTASGLEEDDALHAEEIYPLRMEQAEVVVLSACNTGYGQLHRGEGVQSLSRAFAFLGIPTVVMSLWKAPDQATSDIMIAFFNHLHEGLPKDEALRQAKLEYLATQKGVLARHPYFWSGFIASGSMESMTLAPESKRGRRLPGILSLLIVGLVAGWLYFRY